MTVVCRTGMTLACGDGRSVRTRRTCRDRPPPNIAANGPGKARRIMPGPNRGRASAAPATASDNATAARTVHRRMTASSCRPIQRARPRQGSICVSGRNGLKFALESVQDRDMSMRAVVTCAFGLLLSLLAPAARAQEALPSGFVDAAAVVEGLVVDMRYFGDNNFVGQRIDGYERPRCLLTAQAANA